MLKQLTILYKVFHGWFSFKETYLNIYFFKIFKIFFNSFFSAQNNLCSPQRAVQARSYFSHSKSKENCHVTPNNSCNKNNNKQLTAWTTWKWVETWLSITSSSSSSTFQLKASTKFHPLITNLIHYWAEKNFSNSNPSLQTPNPNIGSIVLTWRVLTVWQKTIKCLKICF